MASPPPEKVPKPGLNIYGCLAVNPYKLTIAAEELGIPYNYINIDMSQGEPRSEWFTAINPNGKLPAIVHVKEDGTSVTVFESAACLLYIASEFDKDHKLSYSPSTPEYWAQLSWLSWQVAGFGPMMGQGAHFNRYAVEPVPYASWRYTAECRRLHAVLDKQLGAHAFVAGDDHLTVADVAIFIFVHSAKWCGVDIDEFPNVKAWRDKLLLRPGVQKGLQVPAPYPFSDEAVANPDENAQQFYKVMRKMGGQFIKMATDEWKAKEVVPLPSDHANLPSPEA
ncbi:glutathione S-transferase [Bombardia bombarda]|uniref:Glutathione S-transferase n=1 Tax=Bombardia bombarda TaxID=252184 RepID=A0AA40CAD6_9PEZI|nr:glutathione S-transferase [Bombardia bombarda]